MTINTENDVLEDPEGAVLALRRARNDTFAAEQKIEAFEHVFAAFDELRRTGYVPTGYTPQWRARALTAEEDSRHLRETLAYIDYTLALPMFQNAISDSGKDIVATLNSVRMLLNGGMHPDMRAELVRRGLIPGTPSATDHGEDDGR